MVRSRPAPETTPGSSFAPAPENANEPIPRSISLAILPKLLPPRATPTTTDSRRWLSSVPLAECPFDISMMLCFVILFRMRLLWSLLRSRITTEEFLWSLVNFVSNCFQPNGWAEWVNHVFCTYKPFVVVLSHVGIADAIKVSPFLGVQKRSNDLMMLIQHWSCKTHTFMTSWGEFSSTLEDVAILLKLPMFGDFDLSFVVLERRIAEMSKALKVATAESARHSRKKLALRRAR
ncbi:Aminotransferase-like, plant mobile domain [Sesbania bispinosa]|nr:Aminotransferase-like, plant mobile domain [Sesbania bispinosa]